MGTNIRPFRISVGILASTVLLAAQTQVDLSTQSRHVDFSAASATKPAKTGTSLPVTCGLGEAFFLTTAAPGANWYLCTATNIWALQGAGGGGGGVPGDSVPVAITASDTLTIGSTCSTAQPCNVRMGSSVFGVTGVMKAVVSSGTDTAYVYVTPAGAFTVGVSTAALTCLGGCVIGSGISAFPAGVLPLGRWTIANGAWQSSVDLQAPLSVDGVATGTGLSAVSAGGVTTISVDQSVVAVRAIVPSTSADVCVVGVWAADTSNYYLCVASNQWKRIALVTF